MKNTRELSRFHYLKLVPRSLVSVWPAALGLWWVVVLELSVLIYGWPDIVNGRLEREYPFYGLLPLVYFLFFLGCFVTGFALSGGTEAKALNPLPLKRDKRFLLRLIDSCAVSLILVLLPALVFFHFSSWDRAILAQLTALWLLSRFVQGCLYSGGALLSLWLGRWLDRTLSLLPNLVVVGAMTFSYFFFFKPKFMGPANEWIADLPSSSVLFAILVPATLFSWLCAWGITKASHPRDSLDPSTVSSPPAPTSFLSREEVSQETAGFSSVTTLLNPALAALGAFVLAVSPLIVAEAFGGFHDRFGGDGNGSAFVLATLTTTLFLFPLLVLGILAWRLFHRIRFCQILPVGTLPPIATILFFLLGAAGGMGLFMSVFEAGNGNFSMRWFFPMMMTALVASGVPVCLKMAAPITPREAGAREIDPEGTGVAVGALLIFTLMLWIPLRQPDFDAAYFIPFFSLIYAYGIWAMVWMYRRY